MTYRDIIMHSASKFPANPSLICVTISSFTVVLQLNVNFRSMQACMHGEVKDVLHLSQNIANNFEIKYTLLNKQISLFRKCWASCNNGVNVFLQKRGKGGKRGGRTSLRQLEFDYNPSLFLCCLTSLFLSFSVCFFGRFLLLLLLHLSEQL